MTHTCHDIEPWLARRADDQLDEATRAALDEHLARCPACRRAAVIQDDVRGLLSARAEGLRARASDDLRARLASHHSRRVRQARWTPFRLPAAATALVTVLVLGVYGLTSSSTTLLAAQLALDHLKCVTIVKDGEPGGLDPQRVGEAWTRSYDWTLDVPAAPADGAGRLISARRCLYGHGHLAHLLYDVDGRVVSLFVMPRSEHPAGESVTQRQVFGQQARVWAHGDQTIALVADAETPGVDRLARHFGAE